MLRVTYFGHEPLFCMMQQHFWEVPTTEIAVLLQKVPVKYPMDISWSVLSFWGYSMCKVQYIQLAQGGKVKLWLWQVALPIFAEVAEKVSASSCSSSFSARGYKACNSSSNMNKCQLLAQQLMVCPSRPELFNSHRLSVRSPSFMGGKGLCHRHRSAIRNRVFTNFDRKEIVRLDHKIEIDACSFLVSCWHVPLLSAFSFNNALIYKHSK